MKRYIFNGDKKNIPRMNTDVVIVGSGAAGLYTALHIDPRLHCTVLNKEGPKHCNSMYAQGGIATVIRPNSQQDDPEQHFADTLSAGAGLCDKKAVQVLVDEAWSNIEELIAMKVPFDTQGGNLLLTREGGHGKNRILHCGGDATGSFLTVSLQEAAKKQKNIQIKDNMFLADIVTNEAGVTGVVALDEENKPWLFSASKVVIATGGIGRVYQNSTNDICATGDGMAAAHRAGAKLKDMEFIQFHPTALIRPDGSGRHFLISEALRGEGAILKNERGEPFMQGQHPLADLAPRDIVSRAIMKEMKKNRIPHVYLDITNKSRDFLKARFPTIYQECMSQGIDIAQESIPVVPVQHYCMGGIQTDIDGKTSVPGLYACGEAACTGVHGANRLASNSLLECLVFGRRCARHINGSPLFAAAIDENKPAYPLKSSKDTDKDTDFDALKKEIQLLTTEHCGIIRNGKDLYKAHRQISEIVDQMDCMELTDKKSMETYNLSLISMAIFEACIRRNASVGAHFRSDDKTLGGNHMFNVGNLDTILTRALEEDIGNGDVTTLATVEENKQIEGSFIAKEDGVICGLPVVTRIFELLDPSVLLDFFVKEGEPIKKGGIIGKIAGPARSILTGERVALNFLQRLSGIATRTRAAAAEISGTNAVISDTRKTTPGLRSLEKYAVRVGGGSNHRFNLSDGVLIKDNHISAAGGIREAVARARRFTPHTLKIEVEVESFAQITEALDSGADIIMLDNMSIEDMAKAVGMINGKALVEASGNMGEKNLHKVAEAGVDIISIGALTHTIRAMDISLRFSS